MNILPTLLLISFISIINAQWFIKKTYQTKKMNYPNPGKRNIPEEQPMFIQNDCSLPYSQLQSYRQKMKWIFTCLDSRSSLDTDEGSLPSNLNNLDVELSTIPTYILDKQKSPYLKSSYFTQRKNRVNKFLMNLLHNSESNDK